MRGNQCAVQTAGARSWTGSRATVSGRRRRCTIAASRTVFFFDELLISNVTAKSMTTR
jgi:hypothetical protein